MSPRFYIIRLVSAGEWMLVYNGNSIESNEYLTVPYQDRAEYLCNLLNQQPVDDIV